MTLARNIIGFDLGHGETSIARVSTTTDAAPENLELLGRKNQVTAIARSPEGKVVIGMDALYVAGATEFNVCFKTRVHDDPTYRRVMADYVKEVHAELVRSGQIGEDQPYHYFVGCPSGWSEDDREAYEALLKESGVTPLSVRKESHAALVHANECGLLNTAERLNGAILVIDIGSSTTDFTFSKDRQSPPLSDGHDLGGAMIDRAILMYLLRSNEKRADFEALFKHSLVPYNKCLLECRSVKETVFSSPERYKGGEVEEINVKTQIGRFLGELDTATLEQILNTPLPELGDRTWKQMFQHACMKIRREWIDPHGLKTGVVLATGGASRMRFTKDVCNDIFQGWMYSLGGDPEHAISRGLARWGRLEVRTQGFDTDVRHLLDTQVPKIVNDLLPALIDKLVLMLTDGVVDNAIKRGMKGWLEGRVPSLGGLQAHIEKLAGEWAGSADTKRQLDIRVNEWLAIVQDALEQAGNQVCRKYGIKTGLLHLKDVVYQPTTAMPGVPIGDPTTISEVIENILGAVVVAIIAVVVLTPVGWIAGIVAVVLAAIGGIHFEEKLKGWDLPLFARKKLLSEEKIDQVCRDNRAKIETEVRNALQNDARLNRDLANNIITVLNDSLKQRIDEVRLLIRQE